MTRYIKGYKLDYDKIRATFPRDPTYPYDTDSDYEFSYIRPILRIVPPDAYMGVKHGVEADGESINIVFVLAEGNDKDELESRAVGWDDDVLRDMANAMFTLGVWPDHDTYDYSKGPKA